MSAFTHACRVDDLPEDKPVSMVIDGVDVALVRTDGEVFAIFDGCSHADVALSEGDVDDCHIECWMHGSRFDLRTGVPDAPPAIRPVPVYPVRIEGDGPEAVVLVDTSASLNRS
jgi:3-phenylpropionate/trans-cinnamate dioxygenase ferredoxin subunit